MSSKFESMTGKVDFAFAEYDNPPSNPVGLGSKWYRDAVDEKVREPRSMVLVTADSTGLMSSRVMAILDFSDEGIVFATHSCSRKIKDAEQVPFACGHFYWKELGRQLSVSGVIKPLSRDRAEQEWHKRPVPLHPMSTVSQQSEPLDSYNDLLAQMQELEDKGPLPCPERYSVYLLEPKAIEFWSSSSNRLHRRLRFDYRADKWESLKLQP